MIITEANEQVASGHLLESIELSRILKKCGYKVDLFVNDDACDAFKHRIKGDYSEYSKSVESDLEFFFDILKKTSYDLIITDLREVKNEWIQHIRPFSEANIICIDEWGHRKLNCDIIINPMINPYYWQYGSSNAKIYAGHEYLILPQKIREYHLKQKEISDGIGKVCISMGGVDKYGSTIKITKWLIENQLNLYINVILGGGVSYKDDLIKLVGERENITIRQNIDYIYDIFEESDVAFCAGGNTLHELASIGTPTIVIPTMEHEYNNGKCFEEKGFGVTLSTAEKVLDEDISTAWDSLVDKKRRERMSLKGKEICKGDGGENVAEIIKSLLS